MAQFQYEFADFTDAEMTVDTLNAWGDVGWELVSNEVMFKDGKDVNHLIFKIELLPEGIRKFQYYITEFKEAEMTKETLNGWGENGWELVSSETLFVKGEDGDIHHLIFKAELVDQVVAETST